MELRHIRYFLAVAEERNFTRAAARVGIGQPPLSQQIRDLEEEVGTPLFRRMSHGAELTEAGRAFHAAVRSLPVQVAVAIREAQRAGRGETGVLRIGFTSSAAINPVVPGAIRAFRHRYPEVELTLNENKSASLGASLHEGSLELAFMRPSGIDTVEMNVVSWPDEPMVVALPAGHPALPMAASGPVALASLREELFILTPRMNGPDLFDAAVRACAAAGFELRVGQSAPQIASVLSLVATGQGVSIVPASMRQLALEGVSYRDISDARPVARLALVYPKSSRSALVHNFLEIARRDVQ
ncbi:LysR family transcriptional regulator [Myxococcus sp. NMCA1]|uniref:LysR family transcriptional regulator n=1 Tax=Myxococcus sp. NMCA1 TaxID=2996785 RepID=UPI002285466C|nr:LysR family transcriptional regulator [Myxococcus sp. NMCA1]WAM25188.1 LysR family transcriptional regulator [Myxococcus sp. NMCA1]